MSAHSRETAYSEHSKETAYSEHSGKRHGTVSTRALSRITCTRWTCCGGVQSHRVLCRAACSRLCRRTCRWILGRPTGDRWRHRGGVQSHRFCVGLPVVACVGATVAGFWVGPRVIVGDSVAGFRVTGFCDGLPVGASVVCVGATVTGFWVGPRVIVGDIVAGFRVTGFCVGCP